ncbi:hypothetical protein RV11_GL003429 [Enterococcus phoeniculicola]|jgi:hypothetical protein|uniref:Uncharacterized protein n=1 Tax=Enterococcus phoeniculicola ATCC BAA-412 TaxID=1158610 RepID=R3TM29_9ENTE|nr:hypothetical protein [Enterococcus phoeniculicola]EOL42078.1 hypothetical protein UC3_02426 [Enterococcus phoeniculicola ATCC BAA-412]EOT79643.1 hypothetical protein I589_01155 [Enterococcus phoeniculicola ATCC BAA-412]OJG71708.1 hypothetical protein RV11_GL003429 [Enterococcus phoeniculicola]
MNTETQIIEVLEQALTKLDEVCTKLSKIEGNTHSIEVRQDSLSNGLKQLESSVRNDNFIG